MASTLSDFKIASLAAGFSLGFSTLCVWNAVQQTASIRSPLRSVYIYMVWGEIAANLVIAVLAWLFLDGTLAPSVPLFVGILVLWVFEVQLLMQIIINRIAVVVEDQRLLRRLKWGTAFIITLINISVFLIWIPAHLDPPPFPIIVTVNKYWDRTSKVLILLVDAGLNYFFLRTVNLRIVQYHGLTKYAPLVRFNARLMVLSIAMDLMLICLMSLRNQVVYIQFHPVAYMVKLNIEMSMAALITKIARSSMESQNHEFIIHSSSQNQTVPRSQAIGLRSGVNVHVNAGTGGDATGKQRSMSLSTEMGGIHTFKEVEIRVEDLGLDRKGGGDVDVEIGIGSPAGEPLGWRESSGDSESERGMEAGRGQTFDTRVGRGREGLMLRSEDELPLAPPPPTPLKTGGPLQKKGEGW